jgi:Zn-finger protein
MKRYPTIGVCGLDCGLCPRYYTAGPSRCPGCAGPDFLHKHPSCSFIPCRVEKRNLEVCGECPDFPCAKFKSEEEYRQMKESSSYPTPKKIMPNSDSIREHGIERFLEQQRRRIKLLERMIGDFDDGRSKSYYCKSAALLDPAGLESSLAAAVRRVEEDHVQSNDVKTKARILRGLLDELASKEGVTR